MKHLQKTFFLIFTVLLHTDMSFAAFNDYVVSALDEVNIQLEKVATAQDNYSTMSQEYMQGKLGEFGDLQASVKQAKKVEQAKDKLKNMKNMQKKLQKRLEEAKKMKNDALAAVQELQKLQDEVRDEIKETKNAYTQQIKEAQDLARQSYEKANAQFEAVSAQAQEMQDKINEQKAAQNEPDDNPNLDNIIPPSYEAESNRAAFNLNNTAEITPLPPVLDTMQYNLPQGVSEDGTFLQETISVQPITMLPEKAGLQKTTGMIENAASKSVLPNQKMLQQIPDTSQLLEASANTILRQPVEVMAKNTEKHGVNVNEKTGLSLEEQLLAADENRASARGSAEPKAYQATKRADYPQQGIQSEKPFPQKLPVLDEAKEELLELNSSRQSFGTVNQKILQQLPDSNQFLDGAAGDVLPEPSEMMPEDTEKPEADISEKTELSSEEQSQAVDENQIPTISPAEPKAYQAIKRADYPQRAIRSEKLFQKKSLVFDETKKTSLELNSSRQSFGTVKQELKSGGDLDE